MRLVVLGLGVGGGAKETAPPAVVLSPLSRRQASPASGQVHSYARRSISLLILAVPAVVLSPSSLWQASLVSGQVLACYKGEILIYRYRTFESDKIEFQEIYIYNFVKESDEINWMDMIDDNKSKEIYQIGENN